jgi:hypothetical protein
MATEYETEMEASAFSAWVSKALRTGKVDGLVVEISEVDVDGLAKRLRLRLRFIPSEVGVLR